MKTFRTTGTGNEQTLSEIETDKIPLYPTEQDLLDDLANLEVGQIAGTIDPAESELIGVLIQKIQALESKLESDDVYSTDEVKTNKKWIDGKTIYRKVIDTTFVNGISINIESYNIHKMISLKCIMSDANNNFITINPTYFDGTAFVSVYYSFTYKTINNFSNASFTNNRPCQFILEYTKTTED